MRAFVFVGADNPKAKLSHAHERAITSLHTKYITSSPKLLFLSSFSFIGFTFVSLFTLFFFYFYYCYYYCCLSFTLSLFSMAHTTPLEQNHNNFDYDPAGMEMEMEMERHRKRRKKWKEEVVDVPLRRDPLEVFGMDIMLKILSYLDARSVALSLLVSRAWHAVSSTDRLWASKLEELWLGKAHIPRLSQIRGLSKLAAYSLAVVDGKRNRIMKEDLCDHVWEFHFNKAAPDYWRNLDPYWKGTGRPMRRYFHPDGSQSADPGDKVWGGHECCYLTVTSIVGEDKIREHYVRINRWPRMSVFRKQDWSWELSNHLYSYSSIPDADKEGGTGPLYDV